MKWLWGRITEVLFGAWVCTGDRTWREAKSPGARAVEEIYKEQRINTVTGRKRWVRVYPTHPGKWSGGHQPPRTGDDE